MAMEKPEKPATLEAFRALVAQQSEQLTPRMRDAAHYALEHPNDLALCPLADLARQSQLSPVAFIRMAQALGFAGFSDLKRLFRAPLQQTARPTHSERIRHYGGELTLDRPQDPAAVLRAFSQANIVSLQHLQADADALPLKAAIAQLQGARLVHVIGLRRSYAVASYLAYALNRIGRTAVQITAQGGMVTEQASAVGPQDLLVAISFPPYAADTLKVCEQAKANGAKVLAITNGVLSPLGRIADLLIEVNDAELKGFRSLTSALCVVQTLVMGIAFGKRHRSRKGALAQTGPDLTDIDC
jgi:DNA-binding MurR/RpiR family transcriptional regulator